MKCLILCLLLAGAEMAQVDVNLRDKIVQDWMWRNTGINGTPPAWANPYISGGTANPALFDAIAKNDPQFIQTVVGNLGGSVSGNSLSFQAAPEPGFGDDWLQPVGMIASYGIGGALNGAFSQLPGVAGSVTSTAGAATSGGSMFDRLKALFTGASPTGGSEPYWGVNNRYDLGGGITFDEYGNIVGGTGTNSAGSLTDSQLFGSSYGPSPGMEDYASRVAAEDFEGGQRFLESTGQSYPQFLQSLAAAGIPLATAAGVAKAVASGLGLKEAMSMAGIAAPIAGALLGSSAIKDAGNAQLESARLANDTLNKQFETTREDFRPWREAGVTALNALTAGTAPGGEFTKNYTAPDFNFEADPGYGFRLAEGEKAIERAAAARGMRNSGAQYKDLLRFGQNTASAEYGNAFNRYDTNRKFDYGQFTTDQTNKYNRLAGIAGTGQNAMNTVSGMGQNNANAISNNQTNAGNVNAGATIAGVNALNSGISGAFKNYNDASMLDLFKARWPTVGSQ